MTHVRCTKADLAILGTVQADEAYRIEHEGAVHLIDADPSLLQKAAGLSAPVASYLEQAADEGIRVNVFPASSSICANA